MTGHASIDALLQWLELHQQWLAAAIAISAFLESLALVGIIIPGVAILFALAAIAGGGSLSLSIALAAAFFGAVLGDGVSFLLGRSLQNDLNQRWPFRRFPEVLARGSAYFQKHGGKSVVLGRFIGPIRPVMPLLAGVNGMAPNRFFLFNISSALAWAPFYILPGFSLGTAVQNRDAFPPHLGAGLVALTCLLVGLFLVFTRVNWALQNDRPLYRWIENRFLLNPASAKLWQRLSHRRRGVTAFPLASLTLLLSTAFLFLLLAIGVSILPTVSAIDHAARELFIGLRTPLLDPIFLALTLSADQGSLAALFTLGSLTLWLTKHRVMAAHLACSGVLIWLLSHGIKIGLAIPRPEGVMMPPHSFSFPSGHTSGITVFIGMLASFLARPLALARRQRIYVLASLPVLLVAASRMYLDVHWLSDVTGGALLGLAVCALMRISLSRYDPEPLTLTRPLLLGIVVLNLWLAGYVTWMQASAAMRYAPTHSPSEMATPTAELTPNLPVDQ